MAWCVVFKSSLGHFTIPPHLLLSFPVQLMAKAHAKKPEIYEILVKASAIKCPVGRLTFQHSEFGAGVDFSHAVGGCALIDGLVPVSAQRLYAEN